MSHREVFRALVCLVPLLVYGCDGVGWLPTLSLAVAGIERTEHQLEQTDKKRLILKAEARLKWKIKPAVNRSVTKVYYNGGTTRSRIHCQKCQTNALREWEQRERNRVIDESDRGWRP